MILPDIWNWKPVFGPDGHTFDVITNNELLRVGGGGGLQKAFREKGVRAFIVPPSGQLSQVLNEGDVVVEHNPGDAPEVHAVLTGLGLKKGSLLIPP
ncbi:hypothetical protein HY409_00960 [Candidatus Gottesmanbacteria bacterium]|nr:hypothetical protein [Candidatus Gottesmanbacteria bacterium]